MGSPRESSAAEAENTPSVVSTHKTKARKCFFIVLIDMIDIIISQ
jgi:hypothetical protein